MPPGRNLALGLAAGARCLRGAEVGGLVPSGRRPLDVDPVLGAARVAAFETGDLYPESELVVAEAPAAASGAERTSAAGDGGGAVGASETFTALGARWLKALL